MRCSNCMSVLVEHGTSLKCPSCNLILDLDESFESAAPLDDPYIKASFGDSSSGSSKFSRYALFGLTGVLLLGAGVGIGWFGQTRVTERAQPEAPLTTVETTGEIFQSVNSDQSGDQAIMQTDLPFLDLIASRTEDQSGLVLIGSRALRDPVRSQGNTRFALTFDRSGILRGERALGPVAPGELVSVVGQASGDMTFAVKQRSTVSIISQTADGQRLWGRDFPSSDEKGFETSLFNLAEGIIAVLPGESYNELSVVMIGADSYIDWQRQLPSALGTSALAARTPFDEIVIVSEDANSAGQRVLHLSSLSRAGQLVMSEMVDLRQDQHLLAMTVDENGVTHLLISGAVPRVLSVDALGRTTGDIALPVTAAMEKSGNCAIQKIQTDLQISCLEETGINSAIYDPVAESARSSTLSLGSASGNDQRFLSMSAEYIALASPRPGQTGTTARIIPLEASPSRDLIEIPEPPETGLTDGEANDVELATASTDPADPVLTEPDLATETADQPAIGSGADEVTEASPEAVPEQDPTPPATIEPEPALVETSTDISPPSDNTGTAAAQVLVQNTDYVCRLVCADPNVADIRFTLTSQQTFVMGTALSDIDVIAAAQSGDLCATIQAVPAADEPVSCSPAQ
ncbi:MAG: hypothetical protein QNI84_13180 [Henriciella sp.]|nr:hypothetical protein [Henriciella sp.]